MGPTSLFVVLDPAPAYRARVMATAAREHLRADFSRCQAFRPQRLRALLLGDVRRRCPADRITLRSRSRQRKMIAMDVSSSRILVHPSDPERSRRFYRDTLGLAVHREFGPPENLGLVFFLGGRLAGGVRARSWRANEATSLWLQVRDV